MRISVLIGGSFFVFRDFTEIVSPQSEGLRYPGHYVRTGLGAGSLNKRFAPNGYQLALLARLQFTIFIAGQIFLIIQKDVTKRHPGEFLR